MTAPRRSGILVLSSDFGSDSAYVGQMKGTALMAAPGISVIDLWHGIPPQQVALAARLLPRMWACFPYWAVQVAVVDPGVGTDRRALALHWQGRILVGPDNGLFTQALADGAQVRLIRPDRHAPGPLSRTFHGRDLFAPVGAQLATGTLDFGDLEPLSGEPPVTLDLPVAAELSPGLWQGEVIWVDGFGNLVTNIPAAAVRDGDWEIRLGDMVVAGCRTYGQAREGSPLALVGSFDLVEVAVRNGSAAARFQAGPGTGVLLDN